MFQQLFHIPIINITIFSYGFMLVVAFIVAIEMGKRLGQRRGIDPEQMVTCGLIALVSGLAGRGSALSWRISGFSRGRSTGCGEMFLMRSISGAAGSPITAGFCWQRPAASPMEFPNTFRSASASMLSLRA